MSLHHKYRVLLVDDYVPARITLRSVLNEYVDLQIVGEACDGRQAIEQVAACQPDVVLMDYSMPYMNGIEAARLIKKFWMEHLHATIQRAFPKRASSDSLMAT